MSRVRGKHPRRSPTMLLCRGDTPAWVHHTTPCTQAVHPWVFQSDGQSLWSFPSSSAHPECNYTLHLHTTGISHNFLKMLHVCVCFLYLHAAFVQSHIPFLEGDMIPSQDPAGKLHSFPGSWVGTLGGGLCSQGGPTGRAVTAGGAPKTL